MDRKLSEQMAEMYLAGVQIRRYLSPDDRDEVKRAFMAGYESYPQTSSLRSQASGGSEHGL